MDIGKEIANHLEWMESIASLLGSEEITENEIQVISQQDKCKLGQWLKSEASSMLGDYPEYENLIESHETFHKLAGMLILSLRQGREAEAIEVEAQFIDASKKVIGYLHKFQEAANESMPKRG